MLSFNRRKQSPKAQKAAPPDRSPPVAHSSQLSGVMAWFARYGHHYVEKNRYVGFLAASIVLNVIQASSINQMIPLKEIRPYVVAVDEQSGRPDAQLLTASSYKPGLKEIQYFLARFATNALEIDKYKSKDQLIEASSMTTGVATATLNEWINDQKFFARIKSDDTLTRVPKIDTVTPLDGDAALVRVTTTERALSKPPVTQRWLVTVHYVLSPPKTDAEILKNPLGIYVSTVTIQEELN